MFSDRLSELHLQHINPSTSPNELNTTLTPHSMIHGDACFAYFNKIWGIPSRMDRARSLIASGRLKVAILRNRSTNNPTPLLSGHSTAPASACLARISKFATARSMADVTAWVSQVEKVVAHPWYLMASVLHGTARRNNHWDGLANSLCRHT